MAKFYKIADAALELGIPEKTIRRKINEGALPVLDCGTKRKKVYRVNIEVISDILNEQMKYLGKIS